jgi:hypothetical protein
MVLVELAVSQSERRPATSMADPGLHTFEGQASLTLVNYSTCIQAILVYKAQNLGR